MNTCWVFVHTVPKTVNLKILNKIRLLRINPSVRTKSCKITYTQLNLHFFTVILIMFIYVMVNFSKLGKELYIQCHWPLKTAVSYGLQMCHKVQLYFSPCWSLFIYLCWYYILNTKGLRCDRWIALHYIHLHFTDPAFVPRQLNMKQVTNIHKMTYMGYCRVVTE